MVEKVTSFYSEDELNKLPFKSIGSNAKISKKASFYDKPDIEIGNNVRIDDFCILSGKITIGNYVHISAFVALYGGAGIFIEDFSGISPRSTVFSVSDDFSGNSLIGSQVPEACRNLIEGEVRIAKYVQIGAHSIVLPGIKINEGAIVGASSLVNSDLLPYTISAGVPAKVIKERSKQFLDLIDQYNLT